MWWRASPAARHIDDADARQAIEEKGDDMKLWWLGATLAAFALLCVQPASAQIGIVSVTGGRVEGVTADGVTSFKGIPFAAPPVGNLRWRVPQPVRSWSVIKKADHFGPSCMQDPKTLELFGAPPAMSEDCLYLNVWTPAKSVDARLPVMVWIYGGGFLSGTTSAPMLDGKHFAQKGVVLVSVAYRLGAFGFLADPGLSAESPHQVSGNYGLLDVVAALQWVQANVGKFGGDASRVTIFGQSAGGAVVCMLAASPLAKGLFQGAISESGSLDGGGGLLAAEAVGRSFLAQLGAKDIEAARAVPAGILLKAQSRLGHFVPVLDGYTLVGDPHTLFKTGRFNDTPLLIGFNSNEGASLMPFTLPDAIPARFEALVHADFGPHADEVLALYPHATDAQTRQAGRDLLRDVMGGDAWAWANLYLGEDRNKVHLYYFDRHSPQAPLGPTHGAEIGYVFGNLVSPPLGLDGPPERADVSLSEQIQSYWVNFAKTGNPNGPGLPRWPVFSSSSQRAMCLDSHPHAGPVPNLKQIQAVETARSRAQQEQQAAAAASR